MAKSSSRAADASAPPSGAAPAPGHGDALDARSVEHLLGYLLAVAEVPTRRIFQQAIGEPFGLRPVEFTLLALLLDNGPASPRQIGPALRLPAPHVTTLLDRLARRALLQRRRHPDDGRAVQVVLTDEGRALAARAQAVAATMEDGLLAVLSPSERMRLRTLLRKLARAAEAG
jgi:DNA-binding MarR family transcriptional regulator